MLNPIVSVIVPTKNSSKTLESCLRSIQKQTYKNIEIIVVDNFSTDNTQKIAKKYTKNVYSKGPERSAQRNYAVDQATGFYVTIIDSDMELSLEVIQECVDIMQSSKGLVGAIIPEESFGIGFWAQCKKLERSFYVGVPYMEAARFFKKEDFLKAGGYDKDMISGEDWDLSQRIGKSGELKSIQSFIYHNEGKISLFNTIKKKMYYAKEFAKYTSKTSSTENVQNQTNIVGRYALFFSKPKKLFRNPILGIGMLFMKTCEFGFGGIGYLLARNQK